MSQLVLELRWCHREVGRPAVADGVVAEHEDVAHC
jgi:hypothetical protein